MSQKEEFENTAKGSFLVAAIDFFFAVVFALVGNSMFMPLMLLAGFMWAYGSYFKRKADKIGD